MIESLRTWRVQASARRATTGFIVDALESRGCRMIRRPDPSSAPFAFSFEMPTGERIGVVAYAFTITFTPTTNRPDDEWSFQMKYGSKASGDPDANVHGLYSDPLDVVTTLLCGVDADRGFFVLRDPTFASPVRLFTRVEFKQENVDAIRRDGWAAWERSARRTGSDEPVEIFVGGVKERFLDAVLFERAAKGLSQGERHLLADRPDLFRWMPREEGAAGVDAAALHPLAEEFGLPPEEILTTIANARRLKTAVRGWVAERHLRERLEALEGVEDLEPLDLDGQPDFRLRWRGGPPFRIECKTTLRDRPKEGLARIDFQKTRASKSDPSSRFYGPEQFEVLAGCLHPVTETWEFRYALTADLPRHPTFAGKLATRVVVVDDWPRIPQAVFDEVNRRLRHV